MGKYSIPIRPTCRECTYMCVQLQLNQMPLPFEIVKNGEVVLFNEPTKAQKAEFKLRCAIINFEVMDKKANYSVEKIEFFAILWMHRDPEIEIRKRGEFMADNLYSTKKAIGDYYSVKTKSTIVHFCIIYTIKRAKEMLKNTNYSVKDISIKLNYNTVQYFCIQFKDITDFTPEEYRNAELLKRAKMFARIRSKRIRKKYNICRKKYNN